MRQEVELSGLDLRYESYRMKNRVLERSLLSSIAARGIEEPLEGVEVEGERVLLNGFKRYRCARKLKIQMAPYVSLGEDEVVGIINLLCTSNKKSLNILEQASFIDELMKHRKLSVAQIAVELSRSKSWVSMRAGLVEELTPKIRAPLFAGTFPVYAYMYTLRKFMRMDEVKIEEIERFMVAVSGKGLSLRELEQLTHGYFRGPESLRQEISSGKLALALSRMKQVPKSPDECSECERVLLKELETTQKYMQRVMAKSENPKLSSRAFHAQSHLLTAGIMSFGAVFLQTIRKLNARNGQTESDLPSA